MPEQKDTNFRVTDRRKFNPDGSPREVETEAQSEDRKPQPVSAEPANNIVSFEDQTKRRVEPSAAEPPSPASEASANTGPMSDRQPSAQRAEPSPDRIGGNAPTGRPDELFLSLINMLGVE